MRPRGWELPAFKGHQAALGSPGQAGKARQAIGKLSNRRLGAVQSQLELIRRAAPNGNHKGDTAASSSGGAQEALRESRDMV